MGEGVESALIDVAMDKGNLNFEEAKTFWLQKKEGGQYIAVSSYLLSSDTLRNTDCLTGNLVIAFVKRKIVFGL